MATFKDACFHYQRMNKLNHRVLKLGANSVWIPSPLTKYKGWCLDCCQHTNLTYCTGCSLYHVCQWCSQDKRCFLDDEPHFLRMRTFKEPITRGDLDNLIIMYSLLFPINEMIVKKFTSNVRQNRCRSEYEVEWYNQLLLPITLQALRIHINHDVYYIFGFYESPNKINQTPFAFTNLIDRYDKLILDSINFDRMEHLPIALRNEYALRYFQKTRFISQPQISLCRSHSTENTLENQDAPTSPIQVMRNCVRGHRNWRNEEWNKQCIKIWDSELYLKEISTSYTEHYSVSQQNVIFLDYRLQILVSKVRPNYVSSNHGRNAYRVKRCKWCTLQPSAFWNDFRMVEIYNLIMEFLRILVKSNTNVGHCSSMEKVYDFIPQLFNPYREPQYTNAVNKLFKYLEPVEVNGVEYVLMNHPMNLTLYEISKVIGNGRVPTIMSQVSVECMIKSIISRWFDIDNIRKIPLTLSETNSLYALESFDKLIDEYALQISDSEE
uniref:Non-structural protein 1 n=1 Tax=Rotavirus A TaxID=28875 RepID=A0A0D4BLR6_9REOV|nr:NSP1 protein [Rotavirus A]